MVVIVFVNPFDSDTPSDTTTSGTQTNNIATKSPPPNSPPIASDKSVTTSFNSPLNIALEATDENVDNELTATIVTKPEYGILGPINQTNSTVTYTPNQDFEGTDTFEYKVNDGTADSNNAVVTVTVNGPPNSPPLASDKSVTTSFNSPVDITLETKDENVDDELTAAIVTQPDHGSLGTIDQTNSTVTYTPNKDFEGTDTFEYKVNDGTVDSKNAVVTITVFAPINTPPKASDKSVTTSFNSPIDIVLEATDENGDKVTPSIVSNPANGTLGKVDTNTNKVTYTPNKDFEGTDTFTYKVNDGTDDSDNAVVTVTVSGPVNAAPIASDKSVITSFNSPMDIELEAMDENIDDELTATIVTNPVNGSVNEINQSTGTVTYTPNQEFVGKDKFTYKVNDGTAESNNAVVTITINGSANTSPIALDKSVTTSPGTAVNVTLEATDENVDDELTATIVTNPVNGSVNEINQSTGTVTYTPNQTFEGTDIFEYKVNDGTADSNNAVVTTTVSGPPNSPPKAVDKSVTTSEETSIGISVEATDENVDDELTATIVTQPEHGTLEEIDQSTGTVTYTPEDNYEGEDSFTYKVNDGKNDSNEATVTITVN